MQNNNDEWLVEIRVKDWVFIPEGQSNVVSFEEVIATDEVAARHLGFDQFERRCQYEPIMKRVMHQRGLSLKDCCAPEAVRIEPTEQSQQEGCQNERISRPS